jgi:hypothetical protein
MGEIARLTASSHLPQQVNQYFNRPASNCWRRREEGGEGERKGRESRGKGKEGGGKRSAACRVRAPTNKLRS